ncbi:MAG TPA: hypothetical protein VMZ52_05790 [Bryobacteraceae bacterium]|nr:hypothetical protein [Bryobacteraceae bacterium]
MSRFLETIAAAAGPISCMQKKPDTLKKDRKDATPQTRGKNAAGQTNGEFELDPKRRKGQFTGAGDAPRMHK